MPLRTGIGSLRHAHPSGTNRPRDSGAIVDQRDLVRRAQGGDQDAFAALAGAAVTRLLGVAVVDQPKVGD
jgi:hypothetical protein